MQVHPKGIRLLVGKRLQSEIFVDDLVMPDVDPAPIHIKHASIQDPYLLVHLSDSTVGLFLASSPGRSLQPGSHLEACWLGMAFRRLLSII